TFRDAFDDLGRPQIALRGDTLGNVHAGREHELHLARLVLDRHALEVDDPLRAVGPVIARYAAKVFAFDRALDGVLDPCLNVGGSIPPAAFPERFADHLRARVSAELER